MPEIPIDQPLCAPWIARATDRMIELTQGGEHTADAEEIEHAVRFFGMLEIDATIPDPEIRITRNGRIACSWVNGNKKIVVLIRGPIVGPKRRYSCYAKYIRKIGTFYEDTSTICYPSQVRHGLARLFPQLDARWGLP